MPSSLIADGALAAVTAHDDQLVAVEQVGQLGRINLVEGDVVRRRELQVRQHGVADLAVQAADLGLDVLGRPHVGGQGARLVGDGVEERGVDVVADAEGEDARVGRVLGLDVLQDLVRVGLADGRLAVREEHDGERPARVLAAVAQRGGHRVVDGGAARRLQLLSPTSWPRRPDPTWRPASRRGTCSPWWRSSASRSGPWGRGSPGNTSTPCGPAPS